MWQGSVSAMGSQVGLQPLPVQLPPWSTSSRGGCRAAALSGWSLPGPQAVEPASCAASGGTWGSPRPSVDGWQRSTRPASLHRNRVGCSWAQGRAGPIQHLTPVTTCLRRVLVTCFRRSICASRQGPRATSGCVCVDSVSKSGESHGHNLARGALGWAMSLSFTRSCTRPLETEIKSNFGSLLCEMCGNGTQVTGRVVKGIRMLVVPTHPLWTPALPSSPHPGAPLPAQPHTLACRRGGGGSEPSSLNKTQWGPAAHIAQKGDSGHGEACGPPRGRGRRRRGGASPRVCPPGSMAACPALGLGALLCLSALVQL